MENIRTYTISLIDGRFVSTTMGLWEDKLTPSYVEGDNWKGVINTDGTVVLTYKDDYDWMKVILQPNGHYRVVINGHLDVDKMMELSGELSGKFTLTCDGSVIFRPIPLKGFKQQHHIDVVVFDDPNSDLFDIYNNDDVSEGYYLLDDDAIITNGETTIIERYHEYTRVAVEHATWVIIKNRHTHRCALYTYKDPNELDLPVITGW